MARRIERGIGMAWREREWWILARRRRRDVRRLERTDPGTTEQTPWYPSRDTKEQYERWSRTDASGARNVRCKLRTFSSRFLPKREGSRNSQGTRLFRNNATQPHNPTNTPHKTTYTRPASRARPHAPSSPPPPNLPPSLPALHLPPPLDPHDLVR